MEKMKRLMSFSATVPRGISYQLFNSYLFKTNAMLLQMIGLRSLCGSSEVFCQMTVSHLSNCSDIYIQWESSRGWVICMGLNHCCGLRGLNCSHTERATYCLEIKWLMSNSVTPLIRIGQLLLKLNSQYASYPNWHVILISHTALITSVIACLLGAWKKHLCFSTFLSDISY